jgi:hypothetical protein
LKKTPAKRRKRRLTAWREEGKEMERLPLQTAAIVNCLAYRHTTRYAARYEVTDALLTAGSFATLLEYFGMLLFFGFRLLVFNDFSYKAQYEALFHSRKCRDEPTSLLHILIFAR